jgi:hypothetical protein
LHDTRMRHSWDPPIANFAIQSIIGRYQVFGYERKRGLTTVCL